MKSLKTGFLVVLTTLFTLSSCIEDTVAPEVEQLRQAQINYLNAQIAYQEAQTRLKEAEATEQEILNSYMEAYYAIQIQMNQLDLQLQEAYVADREAYYAAQLVYYDALIAGYQVNVRNAEANLQTAELALQSAIRDLERFLAEDSISDALHWLAKYETVMYDVYNLADNIVSIQNQIAILEIGEKSGTGNSIGYLISASRNDSTQYQSEITDINTTIASLEAIIADPTNAQEVLDSVNADIFDKKREIENLDVALSRAEEADSVAELAYRVQEDIITAYEDTTDVLETATVAIKSILYNIDTEEQNQADAETALASLKSRLETEKAKYTQDTTTLSEIQTEFDTELSTLNDYIDDLNSAQDLVDSAQAAYDIARAKHQYFKDLFTSGDTDLYTTTDSTAAGNAENTALTALNNANNDKTDAQTKRDGQFTVVYGTTDTNNFDGGIQEELATQQNIVDTQETELDNINTDIDTEETNIATAKENIRQYEQDIVQDRADSTNAADAIAAMQADFDAAVGGDLTSTFKTWNEKLKETDDAATALGAAEYSLAVLEDLANILDTDNDGVVNSFDEQYGQLLVDELSDWKSDLETAQRNLNATIVTIQELLAENLDVQARIADLQSELTELQARLADLQALAAEYKALLDEALGQ